MYEQVIRMIIEQCWSQHAAPPRKIAVTPMFFSELRDEMRKKYALYDDPSKEVDLMFGGNTRVYAIPSIEWSRTPPIDPSGHVIAWEVSLSLQL